MKSVADKIKNIRLLICDVDGVLTTGALFYGTNGTDIKKFHVHDGLGIKMLQQSGIPVAIITARQSDAVSQRMKDLKVEYVYQGQANKLLAYEELKQRLSLTDHEIAYIGDDLPDLPVLRRVGFAVTVPNAPKVIQEHVSWTTSLKGGKGAVRELCELIMHTQGTYQSILQPYLDN